MITGLKEGDVLCIADTTTAGWFVRLRDKLPWMGKGNKYARGTYSHVAVVTHTDKNGLPWGIEGKPSRVEFVELTKYLSYPTTIANVNQPKTDEQRTDVVKFMLSLYAVKYDWAAIIKLGAGAFGQHWPWWMEWDEETGVKIPKSVICSSSADFDYEKAGLDNPGGPGITRTTTPDNWASWMIEKGYAVGNDGPIKASD